MFNAKQPSPDELPTAKELARSTVVAIIGAAIVLVTIVLPAEYGVDPTGVGDVLGLTEMGEIKQQLVEEEEDHAGLPTGSATAELSLLAKFGELIISTAHAQEINNAELSLLLKNILRCF